jgi:hypothetical protein
VNIRAEWENSFAGRKYVKEQELKKVLREKTLAERESKKERIRAEGGHPDCIICFEKCNASFRSPVKCAYCPLVICRRCTETYLKESGCTDPVCPECRTGWSDDFLDENLTKKFLLGDYKLGREKVLLDLEKVRLPEYQERAARYIKAKKALTDFETQINLLEMQKEAKPEHLASDLAKTQYENAWKNKVSTAERKAEYINYRTKWLEYIRATKEETQNINKIRISQDYRNSQYTVSSFGRAGIAPAAAAGAAGAAGVTENGRKNHWEFVMKCPSETCQGFVSKNWKCGLCESNVCKDCNEILTDDSHVCSEEVVANVKAIRKEAKPCPKCATMISKIDGCDQMWCTQCQTAFSWRTGEIVNSYVHNPHYFEWRRRNGFEIARAPGDVPGAAAAAEPCVNIGRLTEVCSGTPEISDICRKIRHVHFVDLAQRSVWRRLLHDENHNREHMRVLRLSGELTEDHWKIKLQRIEKAEKKARRVVEVLQVFVQAGSDILRNFISNQTPKEDAAIQLKELRQYCEECLIKIKSRFATTVPTLLN